MTFSESFQLIFNHQDPKIAQIYLYQEKSAKINYYLSTKNRIAQ